MDISQGRVIHNVKNEQQQQPKKKKKESKLKNNMEFADQCVNVISLGGHDK